MTKATAQQAYVWGAGDRITVGDVVARQAELFGPKVCMRFDDDVVTYEDMYRRSIAFANGLASLGIGRQQCVALLMNNGAEMIYAWFAAAHLGAIEVAINSAYKGEFLKHQLNNCEAPVVLVDADLAPRVLEIAKDLPYLKTVVVRGDTCELVRPSWISMLEMSDLLLSSSESVSVAQRPRWDEPCSIIYTGGTTGPSKGAVLSHNYLVTFARVFSAAWGQREDEVIYSPLPLFHLNAKALTVLGSIVAGGSGVLDRRFSVSRTWERVRATEASCISLLGSMLVMLRNLPSSSEDHELPFRCIVGAPVPAELQVELEGRYNCRVVVPYGMTEAAPITLGNLDQPSTPGSTGRAHPLFEVRIFDDDDLEVPIGQPGEVVVRPRQPHVMFEGYHRNAEATVVAWRDLWFHTGDLGRFDENGFFYYVDRKKDAMRRRGENISSYEVERAVSTHPAVQEVAAHAVASEFGEDDVKVCVIVKPGYQLSHVELMDHCVANMPYFAVPRYIEFLNDLPRSPTARVQKYVLRERGVTPQTWDREEANYVIQR